MYCADIFLFPLYIIKFVKSEIHNGGIHITKVRNAGLYTVDTSPSRYVFRTECSPDTYFFMLYKKDRSVKNS